MLAKFSPKLRFPPKVYPACQAFEYTMRASQHRRANFRKERQLPAGIDGNWQLYWWLHAYFPSVSGSVWLRHRISPGGGTLFRCLGIVWRPAACSPPTFVNFGANIWQKRRKVAVFATCWHAFRCGAQAAFAQRDPGPRPFLVPRTFRAHFMAVPYTFRAGTESVGIINSWPDTTAFTNAGPKG